MMGAMGSQDRHRDLDRAFLAELDALPGLETVRDQLADVIAVT